MAEALLIGGFHTLTLFSLSWLIGFPTGALVAIACFLDVRLRAFWRGLAILFATLPLLAVLFWVHYPLQSILGVVWSPYFTTSLVLTIFVFIAVADILCDCMVRIDKRYSDAIRVLGVGWKPYLAQALLPASLSSAVPRLLSLAITTIHATMFASLIGVEELFRVVQRLNAEYLRPVELFSIMGVGYVALCLPLYLLAARARRRLSSAFDNA